MKGLVFLYILNFRPLLGTIGTRESFVFMLTVMMRLISLLLLRSTLPFILRRLMLIGKGPSSIEVKGSGFSRRRDRAVDFFCF